MFKNALYFSFSLFIFLSCNSSPKNVHLQESAPTLTGTIKGFDEDTNVEIALVTPYANTQREVIIEIDANGHFELDLEYPLQYRQGWFSAGRGNSETDPSACSYYAGLIINQGLHVDIDFSQDSTRGYYDVDFVELSGPDAELNKYLNKYSFHRYETNLKEYQDPFPAIMRFSTPVMENYDTLLSIFQHNRTLDSIYINQNPSLYSKYIIEEKKSEEIGMLNTLRWERKMPKTVEDRTQEHQPTMITNSSIIDYYNYQAQRIKGDIMSSGQARVKALKAQYQDNTEQDRLRHFVEEYEKSKTNQPYDTLTVKSDLSYYSNIYKNEILTAQAEAYLDSIQQYGSEKADILNLVGGYEDIWKQEIYMSVAGDRFNNPAYKEIALKEWAKDAPKIEEINNQLANIKVSEFSDDLKGQIEETDFGATLIESSITNVDTLIGVLSNKFSGKHILLDIWATWCGPCLADMKSSLPNLNKLDERDIEVVYLCSNTSGSTDTWRKKIAEVSSPKTHIYMTPELSQSIMSTFKLRGYPSHVFIDKNGKYREGLVKWIEHIDFDDLDEQLSDIRSD